MLLLAEDFICPFEKTDIKIVVERISLTEPMSIF